MSRKTTGEATAKAPRKTDMIRARVDPALRLRAEAVLEQLGLTPSDAIRLFYAQIVMCEGLPFELRVPNATTRKALRDADAGKGLTEYESVAAMIRDLED